VLLGPFSEAGRRGVEVRRARVDDFHGDGKSLQGDVKIARTDWKLLEDGMFGQFEKRGDSIFVLKLTDLPWEFPSCSSGLVGGGDGLATPGAPRLVKCTLDVLEQFEVTPAGSLAIGAAADFDASLDESAVQDGPAVSGFLREAMKRHARSTAFDDVVEVRNLDFAGHVFDLQSRHGLIVACDQESSNDKVGIVTANCQCTITTEFGAGAPEEEIQAIMREQEEALRG